MRAEIIHLSQSGLQVARDCKRKYLWRYERGLQRRWIRAPELQFGKLWHALLALWFAERRPDMVDIWVGQLAESNDQAHRAAAMLDGYIQRWPDLPVMCLSEQALKAPIRNPQTGRASRRFSQFLILDMLALHDDNTVWLWEHKTTSQLTGQYLAKLWSDSQITGYVAALQYAGIRVDGVVYDIAVKPRLRLKKGETDADFWDRIRDWHLSTPEAYHRETVYVSDRQIADWREDVWQVTQELLACRRTGYWYRNTGRCYDYFRECEFAPLCQNGAPEALINAEFEPRESPATDTENQLRKQAVF